jgi:hypothetical protein
MGETSTWEVDLGDQGCRDCPFTSTVHPGNDLQRHEEQCMLVVDDEDLWNEALPTPAAQDGPTPAPEWCPLRCEVVVVRRREAERCDNVG